MFRYIWAWIQALFGYVKVWLQAATEFDPHDSAWLGAAPAMEEDSVTVSQGPIGPLFQQLRSTIASLQGNSGRLKLKGVKAQIQILGQELEWLCIHVKGLPEAPEDAMTRCWMRQIRDLCYDTADYLDELMHFIHNSSGTRRRSIGARTFEGDRLLGSKTFLISRKLTWLSLPKVKRLRRAPLIAKLSALVARVEDADETRQRFKLSPPKSIKHDYAQEAGVSHIMPQIPLQIHIDMLTKLLALDDNEMEKNHKVVTIFGSAGVGKTALARTLFHQHRGRFQHWAFVRVSRDPDMRRLLTDMLSQIKAPPANAFSDVQGLIGSITKHLQGKRYLIIIDDLWTASTWDIIIRALPGGDYCRIITTTQVEDVALACCSYQPKHIYEITPLNDDQSGKSEGGFTEGMKEALNLVYNNLPPRLKTCLLYLNMYPEGCTIRKDELVKQWVAEGLIASVQGQDIEDTAGFYFDALVSSGLVQSVDTNHNGEVLSCTLHHMVLDLIRQKSMEENFITIVNYFQTILGLPDKVRRLSVQLGGAKGANNIPENMRISQVRSLLFSGFFQHVPSILDYGLLQVLILQIWSDQDRTFDLTTIGELYQLRYLKIESNMTVKLPGKIRRLRHLGTLQVDTTLCAVPSDIVHLEKLLHLYLPSESILPHGIGSMTSLRTLGYYDLSSNSKNNVRCLDELKNLQDLQLTCSTGEPAENLEKNMHLVLGSVLQKLSILRSVTLVPASGSCKGNAQPDFGAASSMSISCDQFSSVVPASAHHLEILELSRYCCIFSGLPKWLGELTQLCILKIAVKELTNEDIDILKGLHALSALSLHVQPKSAERIVFVETPRRLARTKENHVLMERIVFDKGGFSVLTYFKFTSSVPWLKLEADAMPNLQNLRLGFTLSAPMVDKEGVAPVIIEHLPGLTNISAKICCAVVDARSALSKAISNDPSNPEVQFMGSIYYGVKGRGVVKREESRGNENIEAHSRIHMPTESSPLPVPVHYREELEDKASTCDIISIQSESEITDAHTGQAGRRRNRTSLQPRGNKKKSQLSPPGIGSIPATPPAMASGSSRPQILCASFNQDNSLFSVGTKEGFRVFDARTGRLCYENKLGGLNVVELRFGTSLVAIIGTGEQPAWSPRRLCLFNTVIGAPKKDLNFRSTVLAVRLSRTRLVVVLQDKTFIYDLNSARILEEIDTVHNPKGLCAFAPNSEWCYLAIPASKTKGSALVYKTSDPELICQIDAHESPLAAMAFSSNGMYLATASEKGTMIRVYIVAQATKSHSFWRGAYPSTIYSLSFGPCVDRPDVLAATSSSGSLHMFFLDAARNGRNQTNKLIGSIIPGSKAMSDALDPANHHVIHSIAPAETKSCLAVHSVEYSQNSSKFPAVRTVVYVVTHDGYFREYTIGTTKSNESSWVLEREFSLLDTGHTLKQNEHQMD